MKRKQYCFWCGVPLGDFDNPNRDILTCGDRECEREARRQDQGDREERRAAAERDEYERYRAPND